MVQQTMGMLESMNGIPTSQTSLHPTSLPMTSLPQTTLPVSAHQVSIQLAVHLV